MYNIHHNTELKPLHRALFECGKVAFIFIIVLTAYLASGCSDRATGPDPEPVVPELTAAISAYSPTSEEGTFGSLTFGPSGGVAPYSQIIIGPSNDTSYVEGYQKSVYLRATGNFQYVYEVTDADGSFAADTAYFDVVAQPVDTLPYDLRFVYSGFNRGVAPHYIEPFGLTTGGDKTWSWNSGAGQTSIDSLPRFEYLEPGEYWLSLVVTDTAGRVDSGSVLITVTPPKVGPPLPLIGSAGEYGVQNQCDSVRNFWNTTRSFNPDQNGDYTVTWDFDDGTLSTLDNPTHEFEVGEYTVKRTLSDMYFSQEVFLNVIVTQPPTDPEDPTDTLEFIVQAGAYDRQNDYDSVVNFWADFISYNDTVSWRWDFGDGYFSTALNPSHEFEVGTHTVTLEASDAYFDTTVSISILVTLPPDDPDPDPDTFFVRLNIPDTVVAGDSFYVHLDPVGDDGTCTYTTFMSNPYTPGINELAFYYAYDADMTHEVYVQAMRHSDGAQFEIIDTIVALPRPQPRSWSACVNLVTSNSYPVDTISVGDAQEGKFNTFAKIAFEVVNWDNDIDFQIKLLGVQQADRYFFSNVPCYDTVWVDMGETRWVKDQLVEGALLSEILDKCHIYVKVIEFFSTETDDLPPGAAPVFRPDGGSQTLNLATARDLRSAAIDQ